MACRAEVESEARGHVSGRVDHDTWPQRRLLVRRGERYVQHALDGPAVPPSPVGVLVQKYPRAICEQDVTGQRSIFGRTGPAPKGSVAFVWCRLKLPLSL